MDRLTLRTADGIAVLEEYNLPVSSLEDFDKLQHILSVLADYEDIFKEYNVRDINDLKNRLDFRYTMKKDIMDEWKAFKQAKQDGLLHIAPCADGTEIYYYMMAHEVPEFTCNTNYLRDNMHLCKTSYLHGFTEYEHGELNNGWFLTQQEAEKALEDIK